MMVNRYMEMALAAAFQRMGRTSPNPPVGAVVVRDGNVLGVGGTCAFGCDHAEVMALSAARDAGHDPAGGEIYVTLEPCNHYGKTPPCTEGLINAGIRKVIVPLLDPNPRVAGRGIARLRSAGVEVEILDSYAPAAADLLRPFTRIIRCGKPFVLNKSAVTLDGRIATASGDSRWITSSPSRYLVHRIRNRVDAVMVGKNTVTADNPMLTVRTGTFPGQDRETCSRAAESLRGHDNYFLRSLLSGTDDDTRDPLRVIAGMPDGLTGSEAVFHDGNHLLFLTGIDHDELKRNGRSSVLDGINHVVLDAVDRAARLEGMLKYLAERGVMFLLVEGGGSLNASFLEAGAIDQFIYIFAPMVAGGGIPVMNGRGPERMADCLRLEDVTTTVIGRDLLVNGYTQEYNYEKGTETCSRD